ncbi:PfkB family carbohydrate kinase [bacterium]|nr:PfkB family carbohydrate kinase [bacterium]
MLEVSSLTGDSNQSSLPAGLSFGGDTLNTAIYLARLGIDVDYVSALGDDEMSSWMLSQWRSEGVGCNLVSRVENTVPGLYMIQIDDQGERSFLYWRSNSPATRMFDNASEAK